MAIFDAWNISVFAYSIYIIVMIGFFVVGILHISLIGEHRSFDLWQINWEVCMMKAIPLFSIFWIMLFSPYLFFTEYFLGILNSFICKSCSSSEDVRAVADIVWLFKVILYAISTVAIAISSICLICTIIYHWFFRSRHLAQCERMVRSAEIITAAYQYPYGRIARLRRSNDYDFNKRLYKRLEVI